MEARSRVDQRLLSGWWWWAIAGYRSVTYVRTYECARANYLRMS